MGSEGEGVGDDRRKKDERKKSTGTCSITREETLGREGKGGRERASSYALGTRSSGSKKRRREEGREEKIIEGCGEGRSPWKGGL